MDQQLKARLIGAAVLVALAVIVIPELLSGRKTVESSPAEAPVRGKRTYTIDLGGGSTSVASNPTLMPKPAAATQPPQAASPAAAEPAAAEPAVAVPEPAPVEMAPPAQEPAPPSKGGWAVQVGAFGNSAAARKLVTDLEGQGYEAFVSPVTRGGKTLHRVRVGPAADRAATDQMAQQLKARGLPATVVAND